MVDLTPACCFLFLQSAIQHPSIMFVLSVCSQGLPSPPWSSDAAPQFPFLSLGIHFCSWIGRVQKNQKTGLRRVQNRSFSFFRVFFVYSPKVDFSSYAPPRSFSRELDHVGSKLSPRDCRETAAAVAVEQQPQSAAVPNGTVPSQHNNQQYKQQSDKQVTSHAAEDLHA